MNDLQKIVDRVIILAYKRGLVYGMIDKVKNDFDIKALETSLKSAVTTLKAHSKRDYLVQSIVEQATDCGIEIGNHPNQALGRMHILSSYRADMLYGFNKLAANFTFEDDDTRSFKQCVEDINELITLLEPLNVTSSKDFDKQNS